MRAQAHMFVGLQYVSQRVGPIDDGLNIARYDARPDAITNGIEATGSLCGVESAQRTTCQGQSLHEQRREVDLALHAPHHANTHNTTVGGGEIQVGLHEIAPCNIKDDIDFPAVARIIELFGEATLAVIRYKRRTERFTASHRAAEPAVEITLAPSAVAI